MSINIWKLDYFLCENSKRLIIECLNIYFALKCNKYLYELIYLSRDICLLEYILIFISHWCGVAHSVKCILCGVAPSRESVLHCVVWPTVFSVFCGVVPSDWSVDCVVKLPAFPEIISPGANKDSLLQTGNCTALQKSAEIGRHMVGSFRSMFN